jgi:hypothetical protein
MSEQDDERAAPAGTLRDPHVSDRLVGAIIESPSIFLEEAATAGVQTAAVRPFCSWKVIRWWEKREHFPYPDPQRDPLSGAAAPEGLGDRDCVREPSRTEAAT